MKLKSWRVASSLRQSLPVRLALLFLSLAACADAAEEARERDLQRRVYERGRQNHWNSVYAPYVTAACKDDPASFQCEKAKFEARTRFAEEEEREAQRQEDRQDRRRAENRKRVCVVSNNIVVCN